MAAALAAHRSRARPSGRRDRPRAPGDRCRPRSRARGGTGRDAPERARRAPRPQVGTRRARRGRPRQHRLRAGARAGQRGGPGRLPRGCGHGVVRSLAGPRRGHVARRCTVVRTAVRRRDDREQRRAPHVGAPRAAGAGAPVLCVPRRAPGALARVGAGLRRGLPPSPALCVRRRPVVDLVRRPLLHLRGRRARGDVRRDRRAADAGGPRTVLHDPGHRHRCAADAVVRAGRRLHGARGGHVERPARGRPLPPDELRGHGRGARPAPGGDDRGDDRGPGRGRRHRAGGDDQRSGAAAAGAHVRARRGQLGRLPAAAG